MDDKGATFLADLLNPADAESVAHPPPSIYLIVIGGGIPGAMLRLSSGSNWLGRSFDNDMQVTDSTISRRHASFRIDDADLVWLTDLGSTNGTHHNGRRLVPHHPILVRDGDRIRFGQSLLVKFVRPDPCEERFQREMFERTVRDTLTGLYNRAFFLDQLGPLVASSAAKGLGLAVLMLDIDHFKRVNDTFGHATGDTVLREAAAVIRQATRPEDLVARYGGEEFVIALPIIGADQATERAERIRKALAARRISVAGGSLKVTASVGLVYAPASRTSVAALALIASADRALYQAKDAGRDRVVTARDRLAPPDEVHLTSDGEASTASSEHLHIAS
ncbi:MAG: GGDEF domain-containing protein [Isosphaeraceae bacterium]